MVNNITKLQSVLLGQDVKSLFAIAMGEMITK